MNLRHVLALVLLTILLASCGGGGLTTTTVSAEGLRYGRVATFTVEGPNLDKGITFVAPKCTGVKEVEGGTQTVRTYTCTPATTGLMQVLVVGGSTVLRSTNFDIAVPRVMMVTNLGNIELELDPKAAPLSVENFVKYVNANFYDKLIFHRVVADFVIQGGGFDESFVAAEPRAAIKLEVNNGLSNLRGTLAMARTAALDSGTSQFYINLKDNINLDTDNGGYAVFGKVRSGMEVVDLIGALPTTRTAGGLTHVPTPPVVILSTVQTQ
jgi:cyclophilin family peptidyl-prolyl cis-trans isomerase